MDENCIFCKIAAGQMGTTIVYEDDEIVAFDDLNPQAPHHVLLVPRKHVGSLNEIAADDEALVGHLLHIAASIAGQRGFGKTGYRTVVNTGADGGQSVHHLHVHLLGGRTMNWPPG